MPINGYHYRQGHKHQKNPDSYADDEPSFEFRIPVYLLRVIIHLKIASEAGMPTPMKAW
jgi:hypothetical protein